MRYTLFVALFLISVRSFTQITCTVIPGDTLLCYKDSIAFTAIVTGVRPITYQWMRNGAIVPFASDSIYAIPSADYPDTGYYRCIATNASGSDTSNRAHLSLHPKMKIDTLYRYNELGCPGSCKGQFKAKVSGGAPPYSYEWGAGHSQDTIVFGLCQGHYTFSVTDTNHCTLAKPYYVDVLKLPKVEFTVKPSDTVYLTNPVTIVMFEDSLKNKMTNWEWDFGDSTLVPNVNPASHPYAKTGKYIIKLNFTDFNGCDTTITYDITVKTAKLKIADVFTPDKDPSHLNETFMIILEDSPEREFSEVYLSNELVILDRWGRTVYTKTNYRSNNEKGDWDGEKLSDGAYFYILKCHGYYGDDVFKGSVTILRKH